MRNSTTNSFVNVNDNNKCRVCVATDAGGVNGETEIIILLLSAPSRMERWLGDYYFLRIMKSFGPARISNVYDKKSYYKYPLRLWSRNKSYRSIMVVVGGDDDCFLSFESHGGATVVCWNARLAAKLFNLPLSLYTFLQMNIYMHEWKQHDSGGLSWCVASCFRLCALLSVSADKQQLARSVWFCAPSHNHFKKTLGQAYDFFPKLIVFFWRTAACHHGAW